jgi:hypothetical protein
MDSYEPIRDLAFLALLLGACSAAPLMTGLAAPDAARAGSSDAGPSDSGDAPVLPPVPERPGCRLPRCFAAFYAATADCAPDFSGACTEQSTLLGSGDVKQTTCWKNGVIEELLSPLDFADGREDLAGRVSRPDGVTLCFSWSASAAGEIIGQAAWLFRYRDASGAEVGTWTLRKDGSSLFTCPDESALLPRSCAENPDGPPIIVPACTPGVCALP